MDIILDEFIVKSITTNRITLEQLTKNTNKEVEQITISNVSKQIKIGDVFKLKLEQEQIDKYERKK